MWRNVTGNRRITGSGVGVWGSRLGSASHQLCDLRQFIVPLSSLYVATETGLSPRGEDEMN